ncbi:MAG: MotA/TolQ/ExbB proton channel family protein, partial [Rubrivivax sp.]|nr:MotA/TolQ/ExbB proton channel family protein [Rubrivivax sp.]
MDSNLGFAHFIAQSDAVGKTLLVLLLGMSVLSWIIIALKGLAQVNRQRRSTKFLDFFWNATSLEAVQHEISTHGAHDPFSHLAAHAMQAQTHHARYGAAKLEEAGTASDFVTRTIKKVLDEETTRLENGLTVLATVGATAPFVGLFGTVWGVYHALVAIGMSGAGTLDKVAGPVGEALIMTGLGL